MGVPGFVQWLNKWRFVVKHKVTKYEITIECSAVSIQAKKYPGKNRVSVSRNHRVFRQRSRRNYVEAMMSVGSVRIRCLDSPGINLDWVVDGSLTIEFDHAAPGINRYKGVVDPWGSAYCG